MTRRRWSSRGLLRFLGVLLVGCSVGVAQGAEHAISGNLGPGMAFDATPFHGWLINGGPGPGAGQRAIAVRFTPAASHQFTSARIPLSALGGPGQVTVFLQEDSGGLPGAILEQMSVGGLTAVPAVVTATSVDNPELRAGTPYWLTVVAGRAGGLVLWSWNSTGDVAADGNFADTQEGAGPWGRIRDPVTRGAFQIHGVPQLILLSVRSAHVLLPRGGPSGAVQLWADFGAAWPAPGDVISVSVGGATLFSAPFSAFSALDRPRTFLLMEKGLLAWFDFGGWELKVMASWALLPPLEPENGYVVELQIGDGLGRERIDLLPRGEHLLQFQRSSPPAEP